MSLDSTVECGLLKRIVQWVQSNQKALLRKHLSSVVLAPPLLASSGICFLFGSRPASLCLFTVDIEQVGLWGGAGGQWQLRYCDRTRQRERERRAGHTWLFTVLNLSSYYLTHSLHCVTLDLTGCHNRFDSSETEKGKETMDIHSLWRSLSWFRISIAWQSLL